MKQPLLHGENDFDGEQNEPLSIEEDIKGFMDTLPPLDQLESLSAKELSGVYSAITDYRLKLKCTRIKPLLGRAHKRLSESNQQGFDATSMEKFRSITRHLDQYAYVVSIKLAKINLLPFSKFDSFPSLDTDDTETFMGASVDQNPPNEKGQPSFRPLFPPKPSGLIEFPLQTPVSGSPAVISGRLQRFTQGQVARVVQNRDDGLGQDENAPMVEIKKIGSKPELMPAIAEKMKIGHVPTRVLNFSEDDMDRGGEYLFNKFKERLAEYGLDGGDYVIVTSKALEQVDEDDGPLPTITLYCSMLSNLCNKGIIENEIEEDLENNFGEFRAMAYLFYNLRDLIGHPKVNSMSENDGLLPASEELPEDGRAFLPYTVFLDVSPVATVSIAIRESKR